MEKSVGWTFTIYSFTRGFVDFLISSNTVAIIRAIGIMTDLIARAIDQAFVGIYNKNQRLV